MIDYKTIVSTTDSKVTLMQWLQSLAKEFDNAKITDMTFSNDGNSSLTFTFKLTDGTTKTATCKAITLTDDEKAIVNGLVGQVTASTDGITFSKAVTFAGNIVIKGNEIHNGYASFLGDESHAGAEMHKGEATFTNLKTDDVTATDGQGLLSYDGTNIVLGSSAKKAVIMGSGDRPTYSKDGSDFTGSELALKSDVEQIVSLNDSVGTLLVGRGTATILGKAYNIYYGNEYLNIDYTLIIKDVTYGDYNQLNVRFDVDMPGNTFITTPLGRLLTQDGVMIKDIASGSGKVGNALVEMWRTDTYVSTGMYAEVQVFNYDTDSIRVTFYKDSTMTPAFVDNIPYIGTLHIRVPFAKEV